MSVIFNGYRRPSGKVGIRNFVAVLPAIHLANELSDRMANKVDGVVKLLHNFEESFLGIDKERGIKSVVGLGASPNVYAVLVVGVHCESITAEEIAKRINEAGGNAYSITITRERNYEQTLEEGVALLRKLIAEADEQKREPCDVSELIVGVRCGGSGAISAISSNAATGAAVDLVIQHGGTAIFSETAELIGADKILAKRAKTPEVAKKLFKTVQNMQDKICAYGVDILGSEPTKFNLDQGLTTIEEKSMGAIVKSGTTPLIDVLEYAAAPTRGPGLYFMDSSVQSPILFAGMIAAGCHLQLFSYGGGFAARSRNLTTYPSNIKTYPVIKIMGSTNDDVAIPYFDIYAGDIIRGEKSIEEVGKELFNKIISIASGEETFTDQAVSYTEMIQLYADGLLM